jgi:hypothetical protein
MPITKFRKVTEASHRNRLRAGLMAPPSAPLNPRKIMTEGTR